MSHPLLSVLLAAADGDHPPVDGGVTFLPALENGDRAIVSLTGHAFIATAQSPSKFEDLALDGFGAALDPHTVLRVAADGGVIGCNDVILVARGVGGSPAIDKTTNRDDHPRVVHARQLRENVTVFGDDKGFFTIANGLAGRQEMSIELTEPGSVSGLGRYYIHQALRTVEAGRALFAAVSPGNTRSLRAFLAAGFKPIGSEVIIDRSDQR